MEDSVNGAYLWTILFKAFKSVERRDLESIRSLGFNCISDFAVLEVLYSKGPLPVSAIGEKVMLTSGSITTAIQRAEKDGLVEKRRDGQDGRVSTVHLTDAGLRRIAKAYEKHVGNLDRVFGALTPKESESLAQLLKKVGKDKRSLHKG